MLLAWKAARVITYAGYILGFPNDTYDSILHDIEVIKRELPVDMLEFFFLTPLPGSEDHQKLVRAGVPLDPDINKYDLSHAVGPHSRMSREEWQRVYRDAWTTYYTDEHMETILKRIGATRGRTSNAVLLLTWFKGSIGIEKVHPLEAGALRFKFRRDRRPGLPLEARWKFYSKYAAETISKISKWIALGARLHWTYRRIKRDIGYTDAAIATSIAEDDVGRERPDADVFGRRQRSAVH